MFIYKYTYEFMNIIYTIYVYNMCSLDPQPPVELVCQAAHV